MKFKYLIAASDGVRVNVRGFSNEESLRKYMKLYNGSFGGIPVNKSVDDIIRDAESQGWCDFKSTKNPIKYTYTLFTADYIESYTDYGLK